MHSLRRGAAEIYPGPFPLPVDVDAHRDRRAIVELIAKAAGGKPRDGAPYALRSVLLHVLHVNAHGAESVAAHGALELSAATCIGAR